MRGILRLVLTLCLFAGLATGAVSHAAELAEHAMPAASGAQHADGDHDKVPSDPDKQAPHHHSICHGHDAAAGMKACPPRFFSRLAQPRPVAESALPHGAPALLLRPPIA